MDPDFKCDCSGAGEALPHFWEHTVGSCHATLALRADWQAQMKRAHDECGFRHVRFHGILDDDMGTCLIVMDQPYYSFFNADGIIDFLLSIGMKPFVELGFMPWGLSSGGKSVFHYQGNVTPPKDYDAWAALIAKLAGHWVERYGIDEVRQWFFEVWNEPNLDAFGSGRIEDYHKLYRSTAQALKGVDPSLRIGGPVTAMNAWIPEFLDFTRAQDLPVDFVSTHHYPTDAFGNPGDDTETQLAKSERSVLARQTATAKAQAGDKPLYYTEWSSSSNPRDHLHDRPYCAAFVVKTIMEARGLVEAYSYWAFSDIFEENYMPHEEFHGGFGLLTLHGVAKPAYRAFQLLHALGDTIHPVAGQHATVDAWVVRGPGAITVLLTNFALPRHPVQAETTRVTLTGIGRAPVAAMIRRIDDDHANPRQAWEAMGSPGYLTREQLAALNLASELSETRLEVAYDDGVVTLEVTMPPQGIAAVTLKL